ncbi:hypothetical protein NQ156_05415 [Microbacterium sp. zg.Y625]|uniref:hypothetical protein n=1 Tax=Microbacterium jiangjiandongii TaxID=3049071 RepID=UPI00214BC202|nr:MULTISPECIES: hypothetical protein [unclassified Microbacterium]MCR2792500.1 hypothetical protein [Microbacterium sp. zg.Y625]WIM26491.1 hypothetical protein QNO14_05440 [Microbacterium sp. zg-Y625]
MRARGAIGAVTSVLLVLGLTACAPEPEPTPTPTATGFASEAEAFAAAEETYRAYVEALNQVDLSDPDTFEAVYAWTTGEANAGEREALSQMHADQWTVSGQTVTTRFFPTTYSPDADTLVTALACSDVSRVTVVDDSGGSMVSPERQDVYALELTFVHSKDTATSLRIASSSAIEDPRCAT